MSPSTDGVSFSSRRTEPAGLRPSARHRVHLQIQGTALAGFGKIGLLHGGRPANIPASLANLLNIYGGWSWASQRSCSAIGQALGVERTPIRSGVAANRPYDFPLTVKGLLPSLRIGVICPQAETRALYAYLQNANGAYQPARTETDYLVDYPGFQTAYGLPLDIPAPGTAGWITCAEPSSSGGASGAISAGAADHRRHRGAAVILRPACRPRLFPAALGWPPRLLRRR